MVEQRLSWVVGVVWQASKPTHSSDPLHPTLLHRLGFGRLSSAATELAGLREGRRLCGSRFAALYLDPPVAGISRQRFPARHWLISDVWL